MSLAAEFSDRAVLLRSNSSASDGGDLERGGVQSPQRSSSTKGSLASDLLKRLDRGFSGSGRRLSVKIRSGRVSGSSPSTPFGSDHGIGGNGRGDDFLADSAPPEWALLLIGCLLGVATGLGVAGFNRGVHVIHEWAWAGTPYEGAAWLRLQRLADTWHWILLIPVLGGVVVGVLHGLLEILEQIKQSTSSQGQDPQGQGVDVFAAIFPIVKAIQAVVTLGTGCSLGPEGPSVDIGKSCAHGFSVTMENNRERRIALIAAGAAAGIASGFNAAVAGCFFAIETVLRPLRAENSPPFTTAMIILASVVSSTVSNAVLGEKQAFTVPTYDLKSAAVSSWISNMGAFCPNDISDAKSSPRGYSIVSPTEDKNEDIWRQAGERDDIELSVIGTSSNYKSIDIDVLLENMKYQAMSNNFLKVSLYHTLREALNHMRDGQQNCLLNDDSEDYLEGILTYGDIKLCLYKRYGDASNSEVDVNTCTVSSMFTRGISYHGRERGLLICYPDTDLVMAKQLMEANGIKQLPVVKMFKEKGSQELWLSFTTTPSGIVSEMN